MDGPQGSFTTKGAMPPVGSYGPPDQGPSASDRAYGTLYDKQTNTGPQHELPRTAFEKVAHPGLGVDKAPETIKLPVPVLDGLDQAWKESGGGTASPVEHGGNVTRDKYNRYGWHATKPGNKDGLNPDEDAVPDGESLVGYGHTHPYSKFENVSFSGEDLAGLVSGKPSVDFLVSGKTYFVVARTREFEAMVDKLDQDGVDALEAKIIDTYNAVYNRDMKLSLPERAEQATLHVCKQFKLVYYRGDRESLHREA